MTKEDIRLDTCITPSIYTEDYIVKFPCPECGEECNIDTSMVLTSLPPKYQYSCPHCGTHGYVLCSEVSNYRFRADVLDVMRNAALYSVKCLICGEEHEFRGNIEQPYICDKCKNAVIKMRKIFEAIEEEED